MADGNNGSITMAMVWMFIISLLLFWLPGIGSLIAGIVGGKRAGGIMAGITAALLPGIIFAVILTFAGAFLPTLPLIGAAIGALVGISSLLIYVLYIPPLLIGALIGGLLA